MFGFCLTSDLRYIVSISNKFITWDLSTSDMTRDVNPGIEGIMQQLVLSPDNRFAAAYTNNNQVSYFAECCSHKTKYCTNYEAPCFYHVLLASIMCSFMQYTDSALLLPSLSCYLELHSQFNPLNAELNPICYLLALLAHHFFHVSRIRVKSLTLRLLMSYIYGAPILDVSRSHTTTQHSR